MAKPNTSRPQPCAAVTGCKNRPKPCRMPSEKSRIRAPQASAVSPAPQAESGRARVAVSSSSSLSQFSPSRSPSRACASRHSGSAVRRRARPRSVGRIVRERSSRPGAISTSPCRSSTRRLRPSVLRSSPTIRARSEIVGSSAWAARFRRRYIVTLSPDGASASSQSRLASCAAWRSAVQRQGSSCVTHWCTYPRPRDGNPRREHSEDRASAGAGSCSAPRARETGRSAGPGAVAAIPLGPLSAPGLFRAPGRIMPALVRQSGPPASPNREAALGHDGPRRGPGGGRRARPARLFGGRRAQGRGLLRAHGRRARRARRDVSRRRAGAPARGEPGPGDSAWCPRWWTGSRPFTLGDPESAPGGAGKARESPRSRRFPPAPPRRGRRRGGCHGRRAGRTRLPPSPLIAPRRVPSRPPAARPQ